MEETNYTQDKTAKKAITIYTDEDVVVDGINSTQNLMKVNQNELLSEIEKVRQDVIIGNAKKKKKCINYKIGVIEGEYSIIKTYDNGDIDSFPLMKDVLGEINVYDVIFDGIRVDKKYYMMLGNNIAVIAKASKRSGRNIYDALVDAGVRFETELSTTVIQRALQEHFAHKIAQGRNYPFVVNALAGWNGGIFYHASNCTRFGNMCDVEMPVSNKRLSCSTLNTYEYYFKDLKRIKKKEYQMIIMLYPFMALIKTLLSDMGLVFSNSICFVNMKNLPIKVFSNWIQIFNRNELLIHDIGSSTKKLEKLLCESKDEVLLYDICLDDYDNKYGEKVQLQNFKNVVHITTVKRTIGEFNRRSDVMSAFVSNKALEGSVYNLYIDDDTYEEDKNIVFSFDYGGVFTDYIQFIGYIFANNIEKMQRIFLDCKGKIHDIRILEGVYELVKKFFYSKQIDICNELDMPKKVEWEDILYELKVNIADDYIVDFVEMIRKSAKNYYIVDRKQSKNIDDIYILYDDNYINIPSCIVDGVLKEKEVLHLRRKILSQLKEKGFLEADKDSYTTRITINKNRIECLKLKKSLFNLPGREDIEKLGKEIEICY